ncbi:MAG: efflux RND transporter periplasmic adaptor subunit [Bacteroidales bacterium]|nr:efflux RND transporter periplasmic adaptor subunit [Bacteroidales bacterium]
MNLNKQIMKQKIIIIAISLIIGIFLGWLLFRSPHKTEVTQQTEEQAGKSTIWTCAMHPQIRMDKPGKCPICGMDLIPLSRAGAADIDPDAIRLTKEAARLASVQTSIVTREKPVKEVRLYGKVQADERSVQSQTSHMPGRIEKLLVNFTGETVNKGQPLAIIYSPELVTAQQELLEAAEIKQVQPEIYEAAKDKLRQWKLTESQISNIESSSKVQEDFEILSNTNGVIIARRVNNGDHVDQGTVLFDVTDLSNVWVMFDAYESDLPFIKTGDRLTFTLQALPGVNFTGNIIFIDPVIDPVTRVAKVRVEMNNESGRLKPEMFASGIVKANLDRYRNKLVIPRSAVLWTGTRSIVYVKQSDIDEPVFKMREIELGPSLGNSYVVVNGLNEGEEIVTNGTFSVDAAAQLEGIPSMMNPEGSIIMKDKSSPVRLTEIITAYLQLKNALVKDNSSDAAAYGPILEETFKNYDKTGLTADQKKTFEEIEADARQHAEHINQSKGDIKHQREHFELLSSDIYDLVKIFGSGQVLYKDFCPMYNDGKGAFWLSEIKEIQNPYYGKEMLTCGTITEVLN